MAACKWVAPWDGGWKVGWEGGCCWIGGWLSACHTEGVAEAGMFEEEVDGGKARLYQKRCGGCGSEGPQDPVCCRVPYSSYGA